MTYDHSFEVGLGWLDQFLRFGACSALHISVYQTFCNPFPVNLLNYATFSGKIQAKQILSHSKKLHESSPLS